MTSRRYRTGTIVPAAKGERLNKDLTEDVSKNKKEIQCELEIQQREQSNRERAKERKIIEEIARKKREENNQNDDTFALPPPSSYDENTSKNPNRNKMIEQAIRNNSSLTRLSKDVKQPKYGSSGVCSKHISREELIEYIQYKEPTSFTFADVPNNRNKAFIAYHNIIIRETEIPIYRTYTTSLQKIIPSKKTTKSRPKQPGEIIILDNNKSKNVDYDLEDDRYYTNLLKKKTKEEVVLPEDGDENYIQRYFPTYEYSFDRENPIEETNTIKDLLSRYQPGMLLDPITLIGVLKRRNCQSSVSSYGESKSYDQLEVWMAETLELKEEEPLVYLIDVLESPERAEQLYQTCLDEDKPCKDILIQELIDIRRSYWEPLSDRSPRAPESLRR